MIEVVFGGSEKGSLKCGQRLASGADGGAALRRGGEQPAPEDAALPEERKTRGIGGGKPLSGRPEDVLGLSFALDIGDIAPPVTDASRRELVARMMGAGRTPVAGGSHNEEDEISRYWDGCVSDWNRLAERAGAGEPVRIWYGSAPYSMCGLYGTVDLLKTCACTVSAVKLPHWAPLGEQEAQSSVSWGEMASEEFARYLPLEFEIPGPVRMAMGMEWDRLKRENAPLRVVLNGKLHSAEADFYDSFIRREIPEGTFQAGMLTGSVMGRGRLGIGDWLIAQRIRRMVGSGELAVVQEGSDFYSTTLMRQP